MIKHPKLYFILVFFITMSTFLFAQNKNDFSLGHNFTFNHFILPESYINKFSFTTGCIAKSHLTSWLKVKTGATYSNKRFYIDYNNTPASQKVTRADIQMEYFNIPFLFGFDFLETENFVFSFSSGLSYNILLNYNKTLTYGYGNIRDGSKYCNIDEWTINFRAGLAIGFFQSKTLSFEFEPYYDHQLSKSSSLPGCYSGNKSINISLIVYYNFRKK